MRAYDVYVDEHWVGVIFLNGMVMPRSGIWGSFPHDEDEYLLFSEMLYDWMGNVGSERWEKYSGARIYHAAYMVARFRPQAQYFERLIEERRESDRQSETASQGVAPSHP